MNNIIKKIVIAGGGTAGWMTAALLKKVLQQRVEIQLVESEEIGIIGVGEATIPPIQTFNSVLGLHEPEFLRETKATIKMAIRFDNWKQQGDSYYHTFGAPGTTIGFSAFQHYWLRAQKQGLNTSIWDYDLNYLCCEAGVFGKFDGKDPLYQVPYAYHFDSALYGRYLRKISEQAGVVRTEGKIREVRLNTDSGFVETLLMENGSEIQGDLFIDCSGMRGLLIQGALQTGYEDWSHWLPCNRALAVPSERFEKTLPYTRSIAHKAGWQWRIPLTHRNGNGLVYSSHHLSDDEATTILLSNLDSTALAEPKPIKFKTGRTLQQWNKNVIAVGLSSGFLEPLESTSIHLIQSAIVRLLKHFPNAGISQAQVNEYNRDSKHEYETVRDFIILHYHLNERADSEFWRYLRNMPIPERLAHKIALFQETGAVMNDPGDIFLDSSWLQVMMGQGIMPRDYHPTADIPGAEQLQSMLARIASTKRQPLTQLSSHDEFLHQYAGVTRAGINRG
ncbi:tryptophan halogenase family protein [Cellvibrio sp. QJXJ]|uniref:tryptophan halogenase family protein n=1 Tax=Cellvibrio sp. QJXJ TaxID=2964606 RepID=UPI0021C47E44|nr:tryptophan halogenase family protein [Cellvibrio sp. QJXJ]UUA74721.1 tryptophan 7-halogenase [Cellvibrio sp. QJXJ]